MKKKLPPLLKEIKSKQLPQIDFASQKLVSYSQLSMFNECPKKWSLQYKEGHKQFTSSIHTVFGTALHEVLQAYLTTMYEKSGAEANRLNTSEMLEDALREEYKKQYKANNKQHFVKPEELSEFYEDGVSIIREFSKDKAKYFSKRGWHLVGVELPLALHPHAKLYNVLFQGYLDLVMYHEPTNRIKIIDIKTSKSGWSKREKSDEQKQFQLILYKKYFSEIYNFPIDNIDIEFMIVKRKLYESEDFVIKRIQLYKPASGKVKLNKVSKSIESFVEQAFDRNGYKDVEHQPTPNDKCKWCPFHKTHLCSATY
jgi:RecB family exonuclease